MKLWCCAALLGLLLTATVMYAFLWGYCIGSMLKEINDWLESWRNK